MYTNSHWNPQFFTPFVNLLRAYWPKRVIFLPRLAFIGLCLMLTVHLPVAAQDPGLCLEPGGIAVVSVTLTNTAAPAAGTYNATMPVGLTAIANSCQAISNNANFGTCTIAGDGLSLTWSGTFTANPQVVTLVYRVRIGTGVSPGAPLPIGGSTIPAANLAATPASVTVTCPSLAAARVSDQKAGSVLVFPYYTSSPAAGGTPAVDTRISITNISPLASTVANQVYVHLFFIDGSSCNQTDFYLCLTPSATYAVGTLSIDPSVTGFLIAVATDANGFPVRNNVLIGNAYVDTATFDGNYGAESFTANSDFLSTNNGINATLFFDGVGYDPVPKSFAVEVQSPASVTQRVVTASVNGDLSTSVLTGAAQVGVGTVYNQNETPFGSFVRWLNGTAPGLCQATGDISNTTPRVPSGMLALIPAGQAGVMRFNVGGAVGIIMANSTTWKGIRSLHKTATIATTLTIPLFTPVCPPTA